MYIIIKSFAMILCVLSADRTGQIYVGDAILEVRSIFFMVLEILSLQSDKYIDNNNR